MIVLSTSKNAAASGSGGVANELSRVHAVDVLGDGAECTGEPEPAGDDHRDLDRSGSDQPDPLALVEVQLGERARARPDPVGHPLVEDLLAERLELGDGVPGDEGEGGRAGLGDVLGVLDADDAEVDLLPGRAEDVAGGEELAAVQAAGEVEDRGALHHGVVHVEERRCRRVGLDGERHLDLGHGGRGLAGQL